MALVQPNKRSPDASLIDKWKKQLSCWPDIDVRAALLDAIAQPTRLRLFYLLDRLGEVCVGDLGEIVGVTQGTVSQHLAKFKAHGLVIARRENQSVYYRLANRPEVEMLREAVLNGLE